MNCKIYIDRFICFLIENKSDARQLLEVCLKAQGLEYKDGELVEIEKPPLTDEQKPISQIQHAQAYVEKDLDLVGYANGVIPNVDEQNILMSSGTSTKENNKPKTIKFNEPGEIDSVWPKEIVDEFLEETRKNTPKVKEQLRKYFADNFSYLFKVNVDKMVEEYKEEESKVLLPLGFSKGNIEHLSIAYKNGLEDMLKLIKEGGE